VVSLNTHLLRAAAMGSSSALSGEAPARRGAWLAGGMRFSRDGRRRYDELAAVAPEVLVGVDFDGTLSPIVADPARAVIHPDGPATLTGLARRVRAIAIVTGRPAAQVADLGRLDEVADALPAGAVLRVLGQYGNEQWDSASREVTSPEPPEGLTAFRAELAGLLAAADAAEAFVEEKGLAVAVHTRRLPDPTDAYQRIAGPLADAAERHGLAVEPGRLVVEVRAPGMDKGQALRAAVEEAGAGGVLFAGDDLGDLDAFEAARALRKEGLPVLLVCSGSEEQRALVELSDVVVDGPEEVLALLREFPGRLG
jgi:trehalose 6-phosphate phosphatase